MTRKPITAAEATPVRVVIVTLDDHLAGSVARAQTALRRELPGLRLEMHSAAHWGEDEAALARCNEAIGGADIVIATMLFMEDHLRAVVPALEARRDSCDAMVVCMSAGEAAKLTRMGRFTTHSSTGGLRGFLKKLRGRTEKSGVAGANQMKMLRRIPRLLKFIPGAAQDIRAYLLTLQYWLAGIGRERREPRSFPDQPLRRRPARRPQGFAQGRRSGRVSRRRRLSSQAAAPPRRRRRGAAQGFAGQGRHGRPDRHALVSACRQQRALRRRDRGAGSARPVRHTRVRERPRRAARDRAFLLSQGRARHRRDGVADRLLARGRPRLQRREGGGRHTCAARRSLPRGPSARVPDDRAMEPVRPRPHARRGDDHGGDPRTRRRPRADGVRRPFREGDRWRPRHAGATRAAPRCWPRA